MELNEKELARCEAYHKDFGPNYNHVLQLFQQLTTWMSTGDTLATEIQTYFASQAYRMRDYASLLHKREREDDTRLCWVFTIEEEWVNRTLAETKFMADNANVWLLFGPSLIGRKFTVVVMPIAETVHERVLDWFADQPYGVTLAPQRWPRELMAMKEEGTYIPKPAPKAISNQEDPNAQEQSTSNPSDPN